MILKFKVKGQSQGQGMSYCHELYYNSSCDATIVLPPLYRVSNRGHYFFWFEKSKMTKSSPFTKINDEEVKNFLFVKYVHPWCNRVITNFFYYFFYFFFIFFYFFKFYFFIFFFILMFLIFLFYFFYFLSFYSSFDLTFIDL